MKRGHYKHNTPIDLTAPLPESARSEPARPVPVRPNHVYGCACLECWAKGLEYGEYLKAKRLEEI